MDEQGGGARKRAGDAFIRVETTMII